MKRLASLAALLIALVPLSAAAGKSSSVAAPDAPRALPADGDVEVRWLDPAQFSELRASGNRWEAQRGDWVTKLAAHLRKSAEKQLPEGERLEIVITDIRRAGNYEPWRGIDLQNVRIMREIYWPRMTLEFKRIGRDGQVVAEGERTLSDPAYLSGPSAFHSGDPLRYEKAMIDRWLRRELKAPAVAAVP